MKKNILFLVFTIVFTFSFSACSSTVIKENNSTKQTKEMNVSTIATMDVVKNSISNTGLTVEFNYFGDNEGMYGSWYSLELKNNDTWTKVPYVIDESTVGWDTVGYLVKKGEVTKDTINWEWLYGKLPNGTYKITRSFIDSKAPGDYNEIKLSDEFVIE